MMKVFYFYLDSALRRKVVRGEEKAPGINYMLYGADSLSQQGVLIHHNLEAEATTSRWSTRLAWLADQTVRALGGSSGNFQTVFQEWRRSRQADVIVSTVDNVGVPLVYLNFFGLLRRPLLYISIGLPERIDSMKSRLVRHFYRTLYRRVPRFVTYGWEEAVRLREWLGLSPDSDRVMFIPFGVDPQAFTPDPTVPITTDVLSIGADRQRDFPLLLAVAAQQSSVSFQIITSSWHAATFGPLPPNVQVLTDVPFAEIRSRLAGSRLVVLPCRENTYSSGTTTLLQAMAMSKPVVVSHTGAIRDGYFLKQNINCRWVSPGSLTELEAAIQTLLPTPRLCQELGMAARKTVEEHLTWDHYVKRLAQVISTMGGQDEGI